MVKARKIAAAHRGGIRHAYKAYVASQHAGVPFYVMCGFLDGHPTEAADMARTASFLFDAWNYYGNWFHVAQAATGRDECAAEIVENIEKWKLLL